jgi:hypothetical protein
MPKLYRYVGPAEIQERVRHATPGVRITSIADLAEWIQSSGQKPDRAGLLVATFVVAADGSLRLADRGSEHVACSGGEPVLSAGEMFFLLTQDGIEVAEVSNQSTGFCPEPASWPVVGAALDRLGIAHPGRLTHEVIFRRCPACSERNIVKDGWFVCGICGAYLPSEWNF